MLEDPEECVETIRAPRGTYGDLPHLASEFGPFRSGRYFGFQPLIVLAARIQILAGLLSAARKASSRIWKRSAESGVVPG